MLKRMLSSCRSAFVPAVAQRLNLLRHVMQTYFVAVFASRADTAFSVFYALCDKKNPSVVAYRASLPCFAIFSSFSYLRAQSPISRKLRFCFLERFQQHHSCRMLVSLCVCADNSETYAKKLKDAHMRKCDGIGTYRETVRCLTALLSWK